MLWWAAPASAGWDDPTGKKKPVLVIPLRYKDWSPPCSPAPCPSTFYGSSFAAAAGSINPPYRTASDWKSFLNTSVDALVLEDSYGTTSFDFQALVNPDAKNGWWDAGRSIEAYGRLGSLLFPDPTVTGLPAPLDDFVKRIPCTVFTSTPFHRLLFIDNLAIGGGLHGRQAITLQCGKTWDVDWTWAHQGGNEAGFSVFADRALGLGLGMRDTGKPCSAYPGRATCFERWDATAGATLGEYAGLQRQTLGWVPSSSVKTLPLPLTKTATFDLQPLNAGLSGTPTLAQVPVVSGPVFKGYLVECRRGPRVNKEGVVVTWVDSAGGQAWIASRSPLTLDTAALAPGQAFVDTANGIEIRAQTATAPRCGVSVGAASVTYPGVTIRPPIDGFGTFDFVSADAGLGMPGDQLPSPWNRHLNPVFVNAFNGGSAPSQGANAVVSVRYPATVAVACGSPPEGDPQNVPLPAIAPGQSGAVSLPWLAGGSSTSPVRIAVHLGGGPGDRAGGGFATTSFAVQTHTAGETKPVQTGFTVAASGHCHGAMLLSSTVTRVPPGWAARIYPRAVRLLPGQSRAMAVFVLAPPNARPGDSVQLSGAIFASAPRERTRGRQPVQDKPAGGFDLFARGVGAGSATLTCPGQTQTGSAATVSGAVSGAGAVLLEYRDPAGAPSLHETHAGANGAYSDSIVPQQAGTWRIQARFQGDATHAAAESAPCSFPVVTPQAPSPPPPQSTGLPDLTISSLEKDSVTVTNRGNAAAGHFRLKIDQTQGTTRFDIDGLGPGESAKRSFNCQQGQVTATADSGDDVTESDEGNNKASILVQGC